nr:hypothetical protein Itr_chr13CG17650 [Ipomoea trifida]
MKCDGSSSPQLKQSAHPPRTATTAPASALKPYPPPPLLRPSLPTPPPPQTGLPSGPVTLTAWYAVITGRHLKSTASPSARPRNPSDLILAAVVRGYEPKSLLKERQLDVRSRIQVYRLK